MQTKARKNSRLYLVSANGNFLHRRVTCCKHSIKVHPPAAGVRWTPKQWEVYYKVINVRCGMSITLKTSEVTMLKKIAPKD